MTIIDQTREFDIQVAQKKYAKLHFNMDLLLLFELNNIIC